jgi:Rieske Fe-S protein
VEPGPGEERPHLPPPSLWPVGFAVGIVCALVGIVVSWYAVAVGAVIAAVFAFLWVRDVTVGYRRAPLPTEPEPGGPESATDAPAIPAHKGEAAMPEPEPGERFPRSVFLENATLGLGAVIGGIVTVPALGFMILPAFSHEHLKEIDLGPISSFPTGQFVIAKFMRDPKQGDVSLRTAYIRNNGFLQGKPDFTIISNRCAHLGCPVQPNGPTFNNKRQTQKTKNGNVTVTPMLPARLLDAPVAGLSGRALLDRVTRASLALARLRALARVEVQRADAPT